MIVHAQRFLHADAAGSALPTLTTRKMLPIRQVLNAVRGLRAEPKAALVEVCELAENGKRKQCDATNAYLAERLGTTGKNVSRLISGLVLGGWLNIEVKPELANRRVLVPTAKTRAYYLPESAPEVSPLMAVSGDTQLRSEDTPKVGIPHPQSGDRVSPKVGRGYPLKWGDLSTTSNDHSTTIEGGGGARMASALAAAEKKIQELEAEKTALQAEVEKVTTQRDQLRNTLLAQRPASHTGGAGRLLDFAASEFSTEAGFRELAGRTNCGQACAAYYLPDMRTKAEGLPQRDAAGWRNYVHSWLKRERDSAAGVVTKLPTPELVGASNTQKARNGVDEARAMLRRRREEGGLSNG